MKKFFILAITVFSFQVLFAQTEVSRDPDGQKVLKGFMTKKQLVTDTAFNWFAENQQGYTPDALALQAFKANRDSINFIAFGGTWCSDTHFVLPRFFALTDAAGISPDRITLLGVDHQKKTIEHLSEAFGVTNVPTIIIMKNGKELGRVVEYGSSGMFDRELGEILTGTK